MAEMAVQSSISLGFSLHDRATDQLVDYLIGIAEEAWREVAPQVPAAPPNSTVTLMTASDSAGMTGS